jgi:hypothetical protein
VNIAHARALLAVPADTRPAETDADSEPDPPHIPPKQCACCGGRMIIIETFARGCQPRHHPTPPASAIKIDTS